MEYEGFSVEKRYSRSPRSMVRLGGERQLQCFISSLSLRGKTDPSRWSLTVGIVFVCEGTCMMTI